VKKPYDPHPTKEEKKKGKYQEEKMEVVIIMVIIMVIKNLKMINKESPLLKL